MTTTNAPDLLFGANLVQTITTGPGSGFTERLLTSQDGDIAEDQMVTATGSYSAAAPLSSGQWIMQMVAFRTSPGSGPAPSVNVSSTNLNFGNVQTGATSSPQPVTVTNVGTAQLTISAIAVSGGNVGDFAQTNTCGATLAPNATCAINVTFTPTNTGTRSSSVLITDNAPGSPQSVNLSGTGTGFTVTPGVSVLTFAGTQQFTASSGSVTWSVDGVAGGSASSGTITTGGLYTPPASTGTHTVTATTSLSQSASATVYITNYPGTFTYHNDNLRTGQNLNETVLTLSNVNQSQFGKLLSYSIDGMAFASPLYVANVSIPGRGYHNVVYVATANDSVYAFDADGLSTTSLWHVSFLKSGVTTVPCADTGECGDILTQIGITSTPVIDQTSGTLYVVAATKEGASTWVQRLHALDITTGAEKFGGPVVLQASVPGTGSGSSGGNVAFDPLRENQRPGLLLSGGVVYLAFGSHGDNSPWHGWVLGYNATTLQQTMYYNVTPNGNGGGIWQGGGGLATDATGDIYYVTSNGDFDANTGGVDYGDSVQKLSSSGVVMDYFTPHDQQNMDVNNLDLGAGGPVLLVDQTTGSFPHLLITAGKNGTIYVVNRDNLGKYNANNDNQIVQSLPGVLPNGSAESGNFSTPVYFNGYVYFGAVNDTLKAFQLTNGQLSTAPTSQSATIYGIRGASFAISANSASNGIIWALQNNGASADNDVGNPGVLFAYNASDLSTELYNSSQAGSRDTLDNAVKFSIPLVANGKVFVAGQTQLTVFGLLP
ncbi:MAG: choice-of-anchor D domain-containing protein [Bryobacteraceae bacterium]